MFWNYSVVNKVKFVFKYFKMAAISTILTHIFDSNPYKLTFWVSSQIFLLMRNTRTHSNTLEGWQASWKNHNVPQNNNLITKQSLAWFLDHIEVQLCCLYQHFHASASKAVKQFPFISNTLKNHNVLQCVSQQFTSFKMPHHCF